MRIIQVHNRYKDLGGEDVVVEREKNLLLNAGHEVFQYIVSNAGINGIREKVETAFAMSYSIEQKKALKDFLRKHPADVVHVHNFLPILSPSIFYACKEMGLPVVLTLHNYRLLCINGLLYRDHKICEDCVPKKFPIDGVIHGCYQNSKIASVFPAASNGIHNALHTWNNKIDKVIFLTSFSRSVFERSHLNFSEAQKTIKPNFVEDRGFSFEKEDYYLFVGRLSEEKGIDSILSAFQKTNKKILIAGEGPYSEEIENVCRQYPNIEFKKFQNQDELALLYKSAKALIFASKLYEGLPLVIIEAFSFGTPVIAPDLGNAGNLIQHEKNGLKYEANNPDSLLLAIEKFESLNPREMSMQARKTYEENYTPEENLKMLLDIYNQISQKRTA